MAITPWLLIERASCSAAGYARVLPLLLFAAEKSARGFDRAGQSATLIARLLSYKRGPSVDVQPLNSASSITGSSQKIFYKFKLRKIARARTKKISTLRRIFYFFIL